MKQIRRARKVTEDEDTKVVHVSECGFFWADVVAVEDEMGSAFPHEVPRTWLCLSYTGFYIEGRFEEVFAEWLAYNSAPDTALVFSRS